MLRFLAVISLLPAIADAQTWSSDLATSDKWLLDVMFGPNYEHGFDYAAHASVSGVASTRYTGPVLAAGGEAAWVLGRCRILHAAAEGTLQKEVASGALSGGFCIPSPLNRFTFTLRTDYQLQPGLAALPVALRSRFTGIRADFSNTFIGWSSATNDHEIFGFAGQIGQIVQPMLDSVHVSIDMHAYRKFTRETQRALDIVVFDQRAAGPAVPAAGGEGVYLSASAYELMPFRLSRQPVGEALGRALELDFAAGVGWATLEAPPPLGSTVTQQLAQQYDLYGAWTLRATQKRGDDDYDTFSISMHRKFEPTYTDELLLDTRADAGWTWQTGKNTIALGAFAARTLRYDATGVVDATPSGGGRAAYVRRLPYSVQLTVAGEVARSFFARLDDTLANTAAWSGQATASLGVTTADD